MVVPWIAVLVVDVFIGPLPHLAIPDGLSADLVTGCPVDLVPLGTVVLAIFFFVVPFRHWWSSWGCGPGVQPPVLQEQNLRCSCFYQTKNTTKYGAFVLAAVLLDFYDRKENTFYFFPFLIFILL